MKIIEPDKDKGWPSHMRADISQGQLIALRDDNKRMQEALESIAHGPVGYWAEPTHHETVIREFMRIAQAALDGKLPCP